jgi:DNA-binding transcriptional ArsR family regulator
MGHKMPTFTLPGPEDCNCFAVRSDARHVSQLYDQLLAPVGLRVTQFSILAKLKRRGPLTINALADDMVMDRTTLGRNIQPLQRDGLIRIEPAPSDRRANARNKIALPRAIRVSARHAGRFVTEPRPGFAQKVTWQIQIRCA